MTGTEQLALDVAPPRVYTCCGRPCSGLSERPTAERPFPHADDCPNPSVGPWVDRATGMIVRRLKCVDDGQPCPHGGACPPQEGMFDPYNAACCKDLARR